MVPRILPEDGQLRTYCVRVVYVIARIWDEGPNHGKMRRGSRSSKGAAMREGLAGNFTTRETRYGRPLQQLKGNGEESRRGESFTFWRWIVRRL